MALRGTLDLHAITRCEARQGHRLDVALTSLAATPDCTVPRIVAPRD